MTATTTTTTTATTIQRRILDRRGGGAAAYGGYGPGTGVGVPTAGNGAPGAPGEATEVPQYAQNWAPGVNGAPQLEQ